MANVKVFEQDINGISFSAKVEDELRPATLTLFKIMTKAYGQ